LLALTCAARATFIETGRITFSGDFTLNHLYDFNNQSAQPFGSFGTQAASQVTEIFSPFGGGSHESVTPGTYEWTWGDGLPNQNFTLQIGPAGVRDGGSTVSLLSLASLGVVALQRKLSRY
jgi:hypothetical protein